VLAAVLEYRRLVGARRELGTAFALGRFVQAPGSSRIAGVSRELGLEQRVPLD